MVIKSIAERVRHEGVKLVGLEQAAFWLVHCSGVVHGKRYAGAYTLKVCVFVLAIKEHLVGGNQAFLSLYFH